ncbi:MAG: hypothetical protein CMN25_13850 [Salinicola sp.]|nr:hypothetical protein [Salinicola sp.]
MMESYDVTIVGAGPAGLAAAQRLSGQGRRVLLIDRGPDISRRDRSDEANLTQGQGGAGLYSDGKFSFFPSATRIWQLPEREALHRAYAWTCELLESYGMQTPPFPDRTDVYTPEEGRWNLKDYPSRYLPLQAREEMVFGLVNGVDIDILTGTCVTSHRYDANEQRHHLQLEGPDAAPGALVSRTMIWATGRFGALDMGNIEKVFRRLEVGFRIDQPSEQAFFQTFSNLDPKLTLQTAEDGIEWRTFCACRNGTTVLTRTQGLWTVSGHSDGPPTARSNVGFNTRILDESMAREAISALQDAMAERDAYFEIPLSAWLEEDAETMARMRRLYGDAVACAMLQGLRQLVDSFPRIEHEATRLIGPTLEGVGWYPGVDGHLRLPGQPTWVVGDACGLFRGIVAAFISGHYAASAVLSTLSEASLQEEPL